MMILDGIYEAHDAVVRRLWVYAMPQVEDVWLSVGTLQQITNASLDDVRRSEQGEGIKVALHGAPWLACKQINNICAPVDTEDISADTIQSADQVSGIVGVVDGRHSQARQVLENPLQSRQRDGLKIRQ